jgi:hypothetical protein
MTRKLLTAAILLAPLLASAEVYKWRDDAGRWHYGDEPRPGAVRVDLPPVQVYEAPPTPQVVPRTDSQAKPEPALSYARAAIISPAPEATIRNAMGEVGVVVLLEPSLRAGHTVRLLVDGKPVSEPVSSTAFTLVNIDRGAHGLAAEVLDARGQVLTRIGPQTFYMHRPSRLH